MTVAGLMKIIKLDLPQASAGTTVTSADMLEREISISEMTEVVAATKINYCKNWTVQEALQTGIPANHIELFGQEYLSETFADSAVAIKYKRFTDPAAIDTLLLTQATALAEATRLNNLWSVQRKVVKYVSLPFLIIEQLGDPQTVMHPRFNLSAGVRGQIIEKITDWTEAKIEFGVIL
jgi:hypothetical protein